MYSSVVPHPKIRIISRERESHVQNPSDGEITSFFRLLFQNNHIATRFVWNGKWEAGGVPLRRRPMRYRRVSTWDSTAAPRKTAQVAALVFSKTSSERTRVADSRPRPNLSLLTSRFSFVSPPWDNCATSDVAHVDIKANLTRVRIQSLATRGWTTRREEVHPSRRGGSASGKSRSCSRPLRAKGRSRARDQEAR